MRRNALRVSELRADIINEIKDFMSYKELKQIEFKKLFTVQLDVASSLTDYDMGIEMVVVKFLTDDGFVITDDSEINLDELNPYELAWILDELECINYIVSELKENENE
jgi:hypothetical protein